MKLNQVIAIEKGIKSRTYAAISELHKVIQKPDLFNGMVRTYKKMDEDGEELPQERKRVQFNVDEVLHGLERNSIELFDVTARKDWANCNATADIKVDGMLILANVPVTYLLFLEKQLTDIRTFVGALPILDEAEEWDKDASSGLFRSSETKTHRTKKVAKPIVLYPATVEHPAQTQMVQEDILAGHWHQVKHSGAMRKPEKDELKSRVEKLLIAVKEARELANGTEETRLTSMGSAIFSYLLPR